MSAQSSSMQTCDVLRNIGFVEDQAVRSDWAPGLSFDFGNLKLSASCVTNLKCSRVVLLTGTLTTKRSVSEVNAELLPEVESLQQGMALLAWCLDQAASGTFEPDRAVLWLAEGRQHSDLLPWKRKRVI